MTMQTTAQGGRFLRTIPEPDAVALIGQVEAAHAALPALKPGVRMLLAGMLYRLDADRYYVSFARLDGRAVVVSGGIQPERKRKGKR